MWLPQKRAYQKVWLTDRHMSDKVITTSHSAKLRRHNSQNQLNAEIFQIQEEKEQEYGTEGEHI